MKLHKVIYLTEDLFFVNSTPLFLTLTRKICFTSVNHLTNRKVETTFKAFKEIYSYYINRGFHITTLHAYGEFSPLQAMVYEHMPGGPMINLTIANEHLPYIERQIRVVKERTRSVRHRLTFNKTTKLITIYIVFTVVMMLNYFPFKGGVSAILSTNTINNGEKLHYKRHLGINIGQYCQVHEYEDPSKSQLPQTKGAIFLGPSVNGQGGFLFMSLNLEKISPEGVGTPYQFMTLSYTTSTS